MIDLKETILKFAKSNDIDLIGFAAKDRFRDLPDIKNPFSVFPEGKTVIMIGERITRGALRGVEEGSNFTDYGIYGYSYLDDVFTAQSCYDITCFIEDNGYEAVPVFPNPPESAGMGRKVREDRPAPNVTPDFNYAAVACGLGEIGLNGQVLTPEYGTRQRFQMIITDAEIESDPISEAKLCDSCGLCAFTCPLDAVNVDDIEGLSICGKEMKVASIDYTKCNVCKNGAVPNRLYKAAAPDRIAAVCSRTCLDHLEETGCLLNKFGNSFRTRKAWTIDVYGKNAGTEQE